MPALVVEFLGLPGSGKSVLAHATARVLRERGVDVHEPTYKLAHERGEAARQVTKAWQTLTATVRSPRDTFSWFRAFAASRQARRSGLIKLTVNWLHLTTVLERAGRSAGVILLDQGLLQALWSVEYEARRSLLESERLAERLADCLPERAAIVLTEASLTTVERRLAGRPGATSRLEQAPDLEVTRSLAWAREALARVEALGTAVAARRGIPLLRVANDEDGGLDATAQWLGDKISALSRGATGPGATSAARERQSG